MAHLDEGLSAEALLALEVEKPITFFSGDTEINSIPI
jgi:hypothetical protein